MSGRKTAENLPLLDLQEAIAAIKHITKAIKKDIKRRREPDASFDFGKVEAELAEAGARIKNGLLKLESPASTVAAAERLELQKALKELLVAARALGDVL